MWCPWSKLLLKLAIMLLLKPMNGSTRAILKLIRDLTLADSTASHQCSGSSRASGETFTCYSEGRINRSGA